MPKLRAGLVGLGMMGRHHARVLTTLSGVDFVGACDPVGDVNNSLHGRPVVSTIPELISLGIDYAIVAVPTTQHFSVGIELASHGVHAMIEKPLSHDSTTSIGLISAFSAAGLIGAVGHIERFNPALQEAKLRIDELGSLYQIVTRRQGPLPGRINDVGVVNDLATHDIDLTSWLTGQRYAEVSARATIRPDREHEDLVAVVGTLQNGLIANHLINWLSPFKERITILTGQNGAFIADTLTADLTFFANGQKPSDWSEIEHFRGVSEGNVIRYAIAKKEPLVTEHENFRDALLGMPSNIVTFEQGLMNIRVAEAVIDSSTNKRTVEILY